MHFINTKQVNVIGWLTLYCVEYINALLIEVPHCCIKVTAVFTYTAFKIDIEVDILRQKSDFYNQIRRR